MMHPWLMWCPSMRYSSAWSETVLVGHRWAKLDMGTEFVRPKNKNWSWLVDVGWILFCMMKCFFDWLDFWLAGCFLGWLGCFFK